MDSSNWACACLNVDGMADKAPNRYRSIILSMDVDYRHAKERYDLDFQLIFEKLRCREAKYQ